MSVTKDAADASELDFLVLRRILYDAERVDPEIAHADGVHDVDCVQYCLGNQGQLDPCCVRGHIGEDRAVRLWPAPHIAERGVRRTGPVRFEEPWMQGIRAIEDTSRKQRFVV